MWGGRAVTAPVPKAPWCCSEFASSGLPRLIPPLGALDVICLRCARRSVYERVDGKTGRHASLMASGGAATQDKTNERTYQTRTDDVHRFVIHATEQAEVLLDVGAASEAGNAIEHGNCTAKLCTLRCFDSTIRRR